jgi:UDP-glucose 4-epimerase
MNILVTGGFGYIGGRIAVQLERAGHQITLGTSKKKSAVMVATR